ncbi:50S ribosomal protein L11 methyltransferase [Flaviaesturariibacter flavus]|uniref:Ribosomal protein L11 methyltransferase n=1 Tax=Flaviaesturariibacter flavus TaxID=2502780 RepID=A0A4R1BPD5_9BACT|nr:50S ribosomal protein L11 methyltransferase [Flaviaesturariibacter flavus]TCJ19216.1 50S ribosomal protein L11 methyltransferase [Flaviaesturariibacter flavus]
MNHILINIPAEPAQQEVAIGLLSEIATGFEQQDDRILAYIEEGSVSHEDVTEILRGFSYSTEVIGARNWNAEWEKNFPPVIVNDFVAVRAHFHEPIKSVKHELVITPKMSFGTGHHATTWQVMQAMETVDFKDKTVFDFGTGTGVLAILAEKLGAASVLAIDNDPWSIENAEENCERNGCTRVEVKLSSVLPEAGQYDVIIANINRNVLLQHVDQLARINVPGGYLLLSGLLVEDRPVIEEAYSEKGYEPHRYTEKNGWISLGFVNKL